jgi:prophage regulatory protein
MKKLIKRNEVLKMCGISTSTLYRLIKSGHFPSAVKTSERAVAWIENEVAEWIETRIFERDSQLNPRAGADNDKD